MNELAGRLLLDGGLRPGRQLAGSAMGQMEMILGRVSCGVVKISDALTTAWTAPARALGIDDEYGALALGACADLIVLDSSTYRLKQVWIAGSVLSD